MSKSDEYYEGIFQSMLAGQCPEGDDPEDAEERGRNREIAQNLKVVQGQVEVRLYDRWVEYRNEVIHGLMEEYEGMTPDQIMEDFKLMLSQE